MDLSELPLLKELSEHGYNIVLGSQLPPAENKYHDTGLPPRKDAGCYAGRYAEAGCRRSEDGETPDRIREMRRLYEYGSTSAGTRARNFYRQAVFMEDYEDDLPWSGDFYCYFPTYHDLTDRQLRGYFTWRTHVRRGEFRPISASAAYIYIYELLNDIGGASPEDCLNRLVAFRQGYVDSGIGDKRMGTYLRRWIPEYAVTHGLPQETVRQLIDPVKMKWDTALSALHDPYSHSDDEVYAALCGLGSGQTDRSPVITRDPERGKHLFSEAWKAAFRHCLQGKDLFTLCFGERKTGRWYPLFNIVRYDPGPPADREYVLNDVRRYYCKDGLWYVESYEKLYFERSRLRAFLHETDARLRRYLKTGRYLREKPADEWMAPCIDAVIEADRKAQIEAARPKITIDLSGLDQIRKDAAITRDSLLTDEEPDTYEEERLTEDNENMGAEDIPESMLARDGSAEAPLDNVQMEIVRTLLGGEDPSDLLKAHHLMPSITADQISGGLFDEIGDNAIVCENGKLLLVEDYEDDVKQLLGGVING